MAAGYGLNVRWSLVDAPEGTEQRLRDYVVSTSLRKFAVRGGLEFKLWRMREGEWFEGVYIWHTQAARDKFLDTFTAEAENAVGTQLAGSPPEVIQTFEVVGVAEGPAGFGRGPGPGE